MNANSTIVQPPKTISEVIYQWIVLNLILIGYLCLVLVCALLASAFAKAADGATTLQRVAGTLLGVILASTILGFVWSYYVINPWLMAFASSVSGIGAYKISQWTMDLWQKSENAGQFLGKIGRIVVAIKRIANGEDFPTKPKNDDTDTNLAS